MELQAEPCQPVLYMAPLQGYTDAAYREAFQRCFGTVEACFAPYISLGKQMKVEGLDDLLVPKPYQQTLIPQLLASSLPELSVLLNAIAVHGYQEVNMNMGCPYPMVTGKGRGAALIRKPELVKQMIEFAVHELDMKFSIKVRSGMESNEEIFSLLDKLPLDKLNAVILHPRTARQLYRGIADTALAVRCVKAYPHVRWVYNGDVFCFNDYVQKQELLPEVKHWMLGRGLLENPFLPGLILQQHDGLPPGWEQQLVRFMDTLLDCLIRDSHDEWHALNRGRIQLTYLLNGFQEFKKERKQVVKSRSINDLRNAISNIARSTST